MNTRPWLLVSEPEQAKGKLKGRVLQVHSDVTCPAVPIEGFGVAYYRCYWFFYADERWLVAAYGDHPSREDVVQLIARENVPPWKTRP